MITATSVVDGITSASSALTVVQPSESAQQQRRRLQFRVLTGVGFACPQDSLAQCATYTKSRGIDLESWAHVVARVFELSGAPL